MAVEETSAQIACLLKDNAFIALLPVHLECRFETERRHEDQNATVTARNAAVGNDIWHPSIRPAFPRKTDMPIAMTRQRVIAEYRPYVVVMTPAICPRQAARRAFRERAWKLAADANSLHPVHADLRSLQQRCSPAAVQAGLATFAS